MLYRVLAVACLAFLTGSGLLAKEPVAGPYIGWPLTDALKDLTSLGLKIIFSSRVVRPDMRVSSEPRSRSLRGILEELVAPHGLRVTNGPGGSLLVVRSRLVQPKKKTAQSEIPLSGKIKVSFRRLDDHRMLSASSVQLMGLGKHASVSTDGTVLIAGIPAGIYNLEAFLPGLAGSAIQTLSVTAGETVEVVLDVAELPNGIDLEATRLPPLTLVLIEGARFRETVEVSATSDRVSAAATVLSVGPKDVMGMAGSGDNVFRTLQTLPGVEAANEFDSRIAVRGGSPDQSLTVIDGVEILNPYHQLGFSSALNPETVESFELSAGGFDVRYGDRLSSLLVVQNRLGTREHTFGGSAALSILGTDLSMEGRLPGKQNGSWLMTGRTSLYNVVGGNLIDYLPSFADLQTRVTWEPRPGRRVSFFGIVGREAGEHQKHGTLLEHYIIRMRGRDTLASVRFESDLGPRASLRTVASFNRFVYGGGLRGTMSSVARAANGKWYYDTDQVDVVFNREVDARDWSLRQELSIQPTEGQLLEAGFELHQLQTRWGWLVEGDRSPRYTNQSMPSPYGLPGKSLPSFLDSRRGYTRTGVWIQDRMRATSRIVPQLGLRLDHSGINGETTISPRASVSLRLGEATRVRAAAGVYHQSPGYEKLFQSDYFVDLSERSELGLQSERSFHTVLAVEHEFTPAVAARIEAYHKSFSDLIIGRPETEEELRARMALYDFACFEDDVPAEPQITVYPTNDARGRSYGIDLYVTKKPVAGDTRLTGWASYSYGVAERQAYGHTFPFDYDRRHSLSVVGQYRLTPSIEIAATARIASGFPWTPPVGIRVAAEEDESDFDGDGNLEELIPVRDYGGQIIYTHDVGGVTNINSARLPVFARIDARLTYRPGGADGRWSLYLDLINLLNRNNAGLMMCKLGYNPKDKRPAIYMERDYYVPFLPHLGVRFRF